MHSKHYFAAIFVLTVLWLPQITVTAETPMMPDERIILLTNRQVLKGEIALYGDRYLITQSNSEIRLPREQVERICQDIQEAYLHLQHQIRFGTAYEHLRLAQWCLDEDLLKEARTQLEAGMLKRPDHPRIDLISRQLEFAKEKHPTASTEESQNQSLYSAEELEDIFDQMPPGIVESFTRVVQPLLLNSCSARGCHGMGGDNPFLLHRSGRGHQPSRRITLRNLHSVLQWIDRENVANSPLLHFAETPHFSGRQKDTKKYFFPPGSLPARRLSAWVSDFSKNENELLRPIPSVALATTEANPRVDTDRSDALFNRTDPLAQWNPHVAAERMSPTKRKHKFRPRDPFDPGIFNDRHHPQLP